MKKGFIILMVFISMALNVRVIAAQECITDSGEILEVEDGDVGTDPGDIEDTGPESEYYTVSGEVRSGGDEL